jgi:hypothetical protein
MTPELEQILVSIIKCRPDLAPEVVLQHAADYSIFEIAHCAAAGAPLPWESGYDRKWRDAKRITAVELEQLAQTKE